MNIIVTRREQKSRGASSAGSLVVPEHGEHRCPCTFRVTEQSGEVNTKNNPPRPTRNEQRPQAQVQSHTSVRPLTGILPLPTYQGPSTVIVSELLTTVIPEDYVSFLHRSETGVR
jgi:hypothetical protein